MCVNSLAVLCFSIDFLANIIYSRQILTVNIILCFHKMSVDGKREIY